MLLQEYLLHVLILKKFKFDQIIIIVRTIIHKDSIYGTIDLF